MSKIIVLGGSVAGLLSGIQLANRGHDVTVLERESRDTVAQPAGAVPEQRPGAPQAVHGHAVLGRVALEIKKNLPELYVALRAAGVGELRLVDAMPASITDRSPMAGDDDLVMLYTRRITLDRILTEFAEQTAGLELRHATAASGLLTDPNGSGPVRITGVQTSAGDRLPADLVIDASGRRTPVPGWLEDLGVELPLEKWDCGLIYFTRHYQIRPGVERPVLNRIFGAGGNLPSWRISWFPGDNDTAMLTHTILAEDQLLKAVRSPDVFLKVAAEVPVISAWLDVSDPISPVFSMGALQNTLRQSHQGGIPLVVGLHQIGDAACTTNPLLGRGIAFAAMSASAVISAIQDEPHDLLAQSNHYAQALEKEIVPGFRQNAINDREISSRMRADLHGTEVEPPISREDQLRADELVFAGMRDPALYRSTMSFAQMLTGGSELNNPDIIKRVREIAPPGITLPLLPGPDRARLTQLLA